MYYIPGDVPSSKKDIFQANMERITRDKKKLFLFAADQKIEHLNDDFYGQGIHHDAARPEHLFQIAQQGDIGAFATQFGLIERYAAQYTGINYIVKLNSKTNLIKTKDSDPISKALWSVDDVMSLKNELQLSICGVGYTVYLGSCYEHEMLTQASQIVHQAHQNGLVAILWIYPRGMHVPDERDVTLLAGAAGVANALGADVVKIPMPQSTTLSAKESFTMIKQAAGNTLVITAGGERIDQELLLQQIADQIKNHYTDGVAIGRNIFQLALPEAIALTQLIASIVYKTA